MWIIFMILGHLRNMSPSNKRLALQIVLISLLCIMSILIHKTTCSELIPFYWNDHFYNSWWLQDSSKEFLVNLHSSVTKGWESSSADGLTLPSPFGKLGQTVRLCEIRIFNCWTKGVSLVIMCILLHIRLFHVVNSNMHNIRMCYVIP